MTKPKNTSQIAVPGLESIPSYGSPVTVYDKGVGIYSTLRPNGKVGLKLDNGDVVEATVVSMNVGPLIDLISNSGPQAVYTVGRIYSPLSLVHALTDAGGGAVLDVTELYTAVSVTVPMPSTAPAGAMTAGQPL